MNTQQAIDQYHRIRIARAIKAFSHRGFTAHVFETGAEAADHFFSSISAGATVGYGGSDTARQIGIHDRLREEDYTFLDRSQFGHSYDEQLDIRRQTLSADAVIASSNAVSIEGALVNIDGTGNRIAALTFGPSVVYLFIGRNKLCNDLERAIYRAKNVASVTLAIQLGRDTPCARSGMCHDCASPDRICSTFSVIERCDPPGRINLYFINEDVGL